MTSKRIIEFIETLRVTQGRHTGEYYDVLPWEKRFIRGAFAPWVSEAAITMARANGKSSLLAAVATAALIGPLRQPRASVVVTAASFAQAKIIFDALRSYLEQKTDIEDRRLWRVLDNAQHAEIVHKPSRASVRCIGADAGRASGLQPSLLLLDEPAAWQGVRGERLYITLLTALGKIPGAKLIALGTRPASGNHWFARMLDGGADYAQVHAAREGDPPFQKRTWRRANPSLDAFPDLEDAIRREAAKARRDATLLPSFEALRLNLGVGDVIENLVIEAATWKGVEGDAAAAGPYVLGIDLGQNVAMSAAAAFWPETGRLEAFAVFPRTPDLLERGRRDGVGDRYSRMHRRGELIQAGDLVSSIPAFLEECLDRWGPPGIISSDRWKAPELREKLDALGFPVCPIDERGQGFKDGGEDMRVFRRAVLEGKVTPVRSLLMRSAMAVARTVMDEAGNSKLARKTEGGRAQLARDDAAAAAILAVSAGVRLWRGESEAEEETELQAVYR